MQMDVQVGGRAEALNERDRTGVGVLTFDARLVDQKGGNDPMDDLRATDESSSGWAANTMRSGIGNESTHSLTGTRGMT